MSARDVTVVTKIDDAADLGEDHRLHHLQGLDRAFAVQADGAANQPISGRGRMGSCGGSGAECGGHNSALRKAAVRIATPSRSMRDSSMPKLGQLSITVTGPSGGKGATPPP